MTVKRTNRIRTLRSNEPIPDGAPRRYRSSHGYTRLRWKVAPYEYVETYEHRVVAGLPAAAVHHRDEDKANNDPDNLLVMSLAEHTRHHGTRHDAGRMAALYQQGLSTPAVARQMGCDPATVYRGLQRAGVTPRSMAEAARLWHAQGCPRAS